MATMFEMMEQLFKRQRDLEQDVRRLASGLQFTSDNRGLSRVAEEIVWRIDHEPVMSLTRFEDDKEDSRPEE